MQLLWNTLNVTAGFVLLGLFPYAVFGQDILKVRDSGAFPKVLHPGQRVGLYLGARPEKPMVLEAELTCAEPSRHSKLNTVLGLRYNGRKLVDCRIDEEYIVLQVPIEANRHEQEENVLEFVNAGIDQIGVERVWVREMDFRTLPEITVALAYPERVNKEVRAAFPYAWYTPGESDETGAFLGRAEKAGMRPLVLLQDPSWLKRYDYAGRFTPVFVSPGPNPGALPMGLVCLLGTIECGKYNVAEVLRQGLERQPNARDLVVRHACRIDGLITLEEKLSTEEAFRIVAMLATAPRYGFSTILLNNPEYFESTFFHTRTTGRVRPLGQVMPLLGKFCSAGGRSLPIRIERQGDEPLAKSLYYGATLDPDGNATILMLSKLRVPSKVTVILPWSGDAVVESVSVSPFPDVGAGQPKGKPVKVQGDGGVGGYLEMAVPGEMFNYLRIVRPGREPDGNERPPDTLPTLPPEKLEAEVAKVAGELTLPPSLFLLESWKPDYRATAFGKARENVSPVVKEASLGQFVKGEELVPANEKSVFFTLPSNVAKVAPAEGGINFKIPSRWNMQGIRGLGIWIKAKTAKSRTVTIELLYGRQRYAISLPNGQWQYALLSVDKVESPALFMLLPASKEPIDVEVNSIDWLAERNYDGMGNNLKSVNIRKAKDSQRIDIRLEGQAGGYLELRRRIPLDFLPDKMVFSDPAMETASAIKLSYHKASGTLCLRGQFPKDISQIDLSLHAAPKEQAKPND